MYEISFTKEYERVAKKFFKKHQNLKEKSAKTILLLQKNPYHPSLRLHKFQGNLSEYHSIFINMEYRIIIDFIIINNEIILLGTGSHDEIY